MNTIESRFLQKAIENKNFISFSYENENYKKVKPLKMIDDKITCDIGSFEISKVKKLTVLRERF